jgi:hypothetical protein
MWTFEKVQDMEMEEREDVNETNAVSNNVS